MSSSRPLLRFTNDGTDDNLHVDCLYETVANLEEVCFINSDGFSAEISVDPQRCLAFLQHKLCAAVWTLGPTGFVEGQINLGVRIPSLHAGQGTA